MIIEPIIPQTQIQVQTPELPKHEFIDRKTARRASMSDIQLNSQQRQVKEIINNYRIEQIYYEQWKETIDKKEDNNNFIIKGLQIKINDYEERLVNYSKMVKELQELKETINRQETYITNLKYDEGKLKEERLTLKNNLEKLIQELQEMKNNQPIMELPQKSNEEIPIMESGEGSQTDKKILAN